MRIIGIHGKMGSGKNHLGALIAERFDEPVYHRSFALPAKKFIEAVTGEKMKCEFGIYSNPVLDYTREQKAKYYDVLQMTIGEFLQDFCQHMRDNMDDCFWIDSMDFDVPVPDPVFIVTDVRYENEFWHLKELGATMVQIYSNETDDSETRSPDHKSESGLKYCCFDFSVKNTFDKRIEKEVDIIVDFL